MSLSLGYPTLLQESTCKSKPNIGLPRGQKKLLGPLFDFLLNPVKVLKQFNEENLFGDMNIY